MVGRLEDGTSQPHPLRDLQISQLWDNSDNVLLFDPFSPSPNHHHGRPGSPCRGLQKFPGGRLPSGVPLSLFHLSPFYPSRWRSGVRHSFRHRCERCPGIPLQNQSAVTPPDRALPLVRRSVFVMRNRPIRLGCWRSEMLHFGLGLQVRLLGSVRIALSPACSRRLRRGRGQCSVAVWGRVLEC